MSTNRDPSVPDPSLTPLQVTPEHLEPAPPAMRLQRARRFARTLRDILLDDEMVLFYRSFDLIRVPYPTRYALRDACWLPHPYLHILNRMFVIQFRTPEGPKTLLASASDVAANIETPFFKRLSTRFGPLSAVMTPLLAPQASTVEACLDRLGLSPEAVDYLTYDHLHTQDLRRWLGSESRPGYFPNARLLVMREEWESAQNLTPPQQYWYCPRGVEGIPAERVVLLEGSVRLGTSVVLLQTPGHTVGNHSIVAHTPEGLMVTSENGVGPDCYAPARSRIPGLRRYARRTGMEVVLNGNTLERGLEQYISMVLEKGLAGASVRNPDFPNIVASSELTPYWLFPGINPSFRFGELEFGQLQLKELDA